MPGQAVKAAEVGGTAPKPNYCYSGSNMLNVYRPQKAQKYTKYVANDREGTAAVHTYLFSLRVFVLKDQKVQCVDVPTSI